MFLESKSKIKENNKIYSKDIGYLQFSFLYSSTNEYLEESPPPIYLSKPTLDSIRGISL